MPSVLFLVPRPVSAAESREAVLLVGGLAVAGLPFGLAIAWRKPRPFRALLERDSGWRWGVAVLALSGMVGFLVNDTSSAAAVAFAYVGLGLVFPSLEARWATSD